MGMTLKMHTPGWRPETGDERLAVVEHCQTLGMSRDEAEKFVRYNAIRRWKCCELGSVADAAKEWIAAAKKSGELPCADDRLKELSKKMHTPGWRPETGDERLAVIEYCQTLGMSNEKASRFLHYNWARKWGCCENGGTVAAAAEEWNRRVPELPPSESECRHQEIMHALGELGKIAERTLLLVGCLARGKIGEAEVRRILGDVAEEAGGFKEVADLAPGGTIASVESGLAREAVDTVEGLEPGGERDGGEGV